MKKLLTAGIIVLATTFSISVNASDRTDAINKELKKGAKAINKKTPIKINKETRLDKVTAGNMSLKYSYTLIAVSSKDKNISKIKKIIPPSIIKQACNTKHSRQTLKNGVTVYSTYKTKDGKKIVTVTVNNKKCKK